MQLANVNQQFKYNDPTWYLVAEYLLNKADVGVGTAAELTTGPLFQTMQELGLPPECLKRIEGTISETARGVRGQLNHGKLNLPVHIRLFSHRMPQGGLPYSGKQMDGGWGYYLIERGGDPPNVACDKSRRVVELYLYQEGDE